MSVRDYWSAMAQIADGSLAKWSTKNAGIALEADVIRGYLAVIQTIGAQQEAVSQHPSIDADADIVASYRETLLLLEKGMRVDLGPFKLSSYCPDNKEVSRKIEQLKVFVVGAYSLDKI